MKKSERLADIHNRYTLTLAERNFCLPGSEHYKQLTEIARTIMTEYQNTENPQNRNRYGFRFYGGKYHLVILHKNEKI